LKLKHNYKYIVKEIRLLYLFFYCIFFNVSWVTRGRSRQIALTSPPSQEGNWTERLDFPSENFRERSIHLAVIQTNSIIKMICWLFLFKAKDKSFEFSVMSWSCVAIKSFSFLSWNTIKCVLIFIYLICLIINFILLLNKY